jgi:hypothetical protein
MSIRRWHDWLTVPVLLAVVCSALTAMSPSVVRASDLVDEGFGATTTGGTGYPEVHVTNLDSAGPGSFREAVSAGHRTVVFDVGGDIVLDDHVFVEGPFVTIDGFSAPPPGITLVGAGLVIRGSRGAHDVIVRGLRVRDSPLDNLQVASGASNVVLSHVSTVGAGDGNLDITEGSHDVTVAWSIIGRPASRKSMLIKYDVARVSLHHNLIVDSPSRNPRVSVDDAGTLATDTTLDMRNNVVWAWGTGFGPLVHSGARANLVRNYLASPSSSAFDKREALLVCSGSPKCLAGDPAAFARGFVQGNVDGDGLTTQINAESTETVAFPAAAVTTTDACTAAAQVLIGAGPRPLDALDASLVSLVTLPGCSTQAMPTMATLGSSANPSTDGESIAFSATVRAVDPDGATPTGIVDFLDDGAVIASRPLVEGTAELSLADLLPGQHTIVAAYRGDVGFDAARSPAVVQKILGTTSLPLRNRSALHLRADLAPCCAGGAPPASVGLATREKLILKNVVRRDIVRMTLTLPLPFAGIVDAATARAAVIRALFSRGGTDYAECQPKYERIRSVRVNGTTTRVASYRLYVDLRPGVEGQQKLGRSVGWCNLSPVFTAFVQGLPDIAHGDVVTVILPLGDNYLPFLEATFTTDD